MTIPELEAIDFIERGGQGDAWRIRRKGRSEEVLKVIIHGDPRRADSEAAALQRLHHKRVMGFTASGTLVGDNEFPFIIGEYVAGRSVAQRLKANERPSTRDAVATVAGVLEGLAAIHDLDIVHRDLKPGNIALRDDDWTDPVILDLGLVKDLLGSTITIYPDLLGAVPFMAPEQLRREPAVRRSDVFAAGVTLFVLLTGSHPFFSEDEGQIAIEVLAERVADFGPDSWPDAPKVTGALKEVVGSMLAPDAFARPKASAAAQILNSLLGDL